MTLSNPSPATRSKARSSGRAGRSRSLTGCNTCRARHAKCDERRPSCRVCQRHGLRCDGYEIRLVFNASDTQTSRCRRPLFTVTMRQRMSEQLAVSADPANIDTILTQMDNDCEEPEERTGTDFNTMLGPFGAFRLPRREEDEDSVELANVLPTAPSLESTAGMDIDGLFSNDPLMEYIFSDVNATYDFQHGDFFNTNLSSPLVNCSDNAFSSPSSARRTDSSMSIEPSLLPPPVYGLMPDDAPFLLSHYKDQVVRLFSPVRFDKTPWQIIHVPNAMETLGQLSMGELACNARMCSFYAILASSAFVQRVSVTQGNYRYWQSKADKYSHQAQVYLKRALHDTTIIPKKIKYKDMLVALLCMVTVSAYQGSMVRMRSCLLDCEHWIRLRGLSKKTKSRKVRLLHHCYVYLRIFHESTSVCQQFMPPGTGISDQSFRLPRWEGHLDQRMSELKERTLGENDLHLEVPGRWDSTLYPLIYGIPESFLFLLSQVTRLANERDLSDSDDCSDVMDLKQFSMRARSLEKCVCAWQTPTSITHGNEYSTSDPDSSLIHFMLLSLHHALLLFFYRRIYDVDVTMLQEKVRHIKDCLSRCDELGLEVPAVGQAASFVWVAFIGACEAKDSDLQAWFVRWFDKSAEKSGLPICQIAKQTAQQVWERASRPLDSTLRCGWPQIMRENSQSLVYI